MPRRIQSTYTKGRRHTIACMGDSLTHNLSLGVRPEQFWPEQLAAKLRALGYAVRSRNFGRSGNNTGGTANNMLYRFGEMRYHDTPKIAVIFGGVNDPTDGISDADTQTNLKVMVKWLKNAAKGYVAAETNLPAGGTEGDIYIVRADGSTTGGVLPDVSGTSAGVHAWKCRNGLAGVNGWGRVNDPAAASWATPYIVLVSPHFLNYTAGADTADAGGTHSGQNATLKAINDDVQAVATAEAVAFCDLYAYLQQRINDGKDTAASASWHVAATNIHLNAHGEELAAQAIQATITAQTGWTAALS